MSRALVNRAFKHWLPVFIWMGVISFMSTDAGSSEHSSRILEPVVHWINPAASREDFNLVHLLFRKAAHLTEYAILGLLTFRAIRLSLPQTSPRWSMWTVGWVTLVVAATYAATDEFHQSFVPGRTPAATDVLIDSCGAAVGLGFIFLRSAAGSLRDDKAAPPSSSQV